VEEEHNVRWTLRYEVGEITDQERDELFRTLRGDPDVKEVTVGVNKIEGDTLIRVIFKPGKDRAQSSGLCDETVDVWFERMRKRLHDRLPSVWERLMGEDTV